MSMAERMKLSEEILALIDRRRTETGDASLGLNIERLVLEAHMKDLEANILEDPGAFEPWLIRRRES